MTLQTPKLEHFYISQEQSIYLLKADDARKHKAWIRLCHTQLNSLGYNNIKLIGKGAYGFVFAGCHALGDEHVFKFSRVTLPQKVQDRLEEEAFMLSQVDHPNVPPLIKFEHVGHQGILVMAKAQGQDLDVRCRLKGALPPHEIMDIAQQLADLLIYLREGATPLVHGDIKPSNLVYNELDKKLSLIDWGSAVFAQQDAFGQHTSNSVMTLMSNDQQHTNARMGDVYFIGEEQLANALSSPRFDEQGVAATLYALASGQISRFGTKVIPATSLGLPQELARTLTGMLDPEPNIRLKAGDYFLKSMSYKTKLLLPPLKTPSPEPDIPISIQEDNRDIETVNYSSRKSFLQQHQHSALEDNRIDDIQLEKYYRNFLAGMGDTEKGFIAAVSRLSQYPIVGGLVIQWQNNGVYIDSNLALCDEGLTLPLIQSINNVVTLARGIHLVGLFKTCFFNAKDTLHFERENAQVPFSPAPNLQLPFEVENTAISENHSRLHSYFEDGKDPEENLELPPEIMTELNWINQIHHTGCIIFEVLPTHLKVHSYLRLLNPRKQVQFRASLDRILMHIDKIQGQGVSGFMKLPYKNTRYFDHIQKKADHFYPKNPKIKL